MQTIVVASRKGGVGKTTIAGHLAVALGEGVAIIDTDPQASLADWFHARANEAPVLFGSDLASLADDLRKIEGRGYRYCIIDTPPAIGADIKRAIRCADLVLVPVRPSPHDLRAVGATVDIVEAEGKRMVFIVNGATPRARLTAGAAIELSQHGTVAPVTLHHRIDYQASMINGGTAQEIDACSKSAGEVGQLREYIVAQLARHASKEAGK
ncbi:ParA family protein [Uliginosibacterium sp. 31-12]|uniref:ParA family protein n=1 Tax=Uliginosibacterium sp. 31-12 TaxID=3062781 RepID=UPI0026E2EAB9|nr:ParA family protein [Uliginosibacterium sp. 31-12]MDO6385562.1 ParA family protein [Uliginosibacterium sp. 31-12]